MKKHEIYCDYDNNDKKYVAVSREFFGLIIYANTENELKKSIVESVRIYTKDNSISGKNIEMFISKAYRKQLLVEKDDAFEKEQQPLTK